MDKPNLTYAVIGAPKCGTTTLCTLLGEHPEVFMTNPKEPVFFGQGFYMKRRDWQWYANLFKGVTDEKAIGEGSVQYTTSYPGRLADPAVIHSSYPDLKLIYMVRNPIKRIESHWLSSSVSGFPHDLPNFKNTIYYHSMYLNTSRYWSHINRFRRYFSDCQIHVVFLEDFKKNSNLELQKVYEFLGVDPSFQVPRSDRVINASNKIYRDGRVMKILRNNSLFRSIQKNTPKFFREILIPIFKVKNTGHPEWEEATLEWAISELQDDSLRFLEYCGKSSDFWSYVGLLSN